jgi:hypothetical protein
MTRKTLFMDSVTVSIMVKRPTFSTKKEKPSPGFILMKNKYLGTGEGIGQGENVCQNALVCVHGVAGFIMKIISGITVHNHNELVIDGLLFRTDDFALARAPGQRESQAQRGQCCTQSD